MSNKLMGIYLREDQINILNKLYSQKKSEIIRDLIDIYLNTEDENKYEGSQLAALLVYKEKSKTQKEFNLKQEELKEEFFSFLNSKNIPIIFAKTSKQKARKIANACVLGFREKGYILPDYKSKELISDYLEWIENSGLVERVYEKYIRSETLYYQKELD